MKIDFLSEFREKKFYKPFYFFMSTDNSEIFFKSFLKNNNFIKENLQVKCNTQILKHGAVHYKTVACNYIVIVFLVGGRYFKK